MKTGFEVVLGRTLGAGVVISTALLAVGLALSMLMPGRTADLLLNAGLLVLMGTPMTRVLLSCIEYVRERDWPPLDGRWFIVHGLGRHDVAPRQTVTDHAGLRWQLERRYECADLSGWRWFVYRRVEP